MPLYRSAEGAAPPKGKKSLLSSHFETGDFEDSALGWRSGLPLRFKALKQSVGFSR